MTPRLLHAQAVTTGVLARLSDRALARLTGGDRVRYLNGQLTIDVCKLPPATARPACLLTARGKLCADLFVHADDQAFWLDADPALHEVLPARLERYVVADDVVIEDHSRGFSRYHFTAERLPFDPPPATVVLSCARFGRSGTDLLVPGPAVHAFEALLPAGIEWGEEALLEMLRIEAGLPRWGAELSGEVLPMEAGLQERAIDYDKGCYVGQEIISRLKSVGQVTRMLRHLVLTDGPPMGPGMVLETADGAPVGTLTSAVFSFALDNWLGLGYVKKLHAMPGTILNARTPGMQEISTLEVRIPNPS